MRTSWKYALLLGVAFAVATGAQAAQKGSGTKNFQFGSTSGESITEGIKFLTSSLGFPVLDIASVPAHSIVAIEQQFIRLETETEASLKADIKKRQSVIQQALKTSQLPEYSNPKLEKREDRFRMLSQVRVNPKDDMEKSWPAVKEGLVNVTDEIENEGKSTTVGLTKNQQKQWTSAAGSLTTKTDYQIYRRYVEQEQAIRMLAQALVLKQQAHEKLKKLQEELEAHYKKTDVPENLKGTGTVKAGDKDGSDYNKALREYAYQSLIYDQLLSLEQQVLGMRLQAKGGMYGQGLQVISDDLEVKGIAEGNK